MIFHRVWKQSMKSNSSQNDGSHNVLSSVLSPFVQNGKYMPKSKELHLATTEEDSFCLGSEDFQDASDAEETYTLKMPADASTEKVRSKSTFKENLNYYFGSCIKTKSK